MIKPIAACALLAMSACGSGIETRFAVARGASALTAADCASGGGKISICHRTASDANPYALLNVASQACAAGHAGHVGDFLAGADTGCACVPHAASCAGAAVGCCGGERCDATGTCQPEGITGRFWRIEIASADTSQGSSVVLTEVEMQWGSAAHVLSGKTLSSPDFWGANPLSTLADGSLDQSNGCYACDYVYTFPIARLDVDLGTPQSVEAILIAQGGFREADGLEWTIAALNVYSSDDGATWTLARAFTGIQRADWTAQTLKPFPLF